MQPDIGSPAVAGARRCVTAARAFEDFGSADLGLARQQRLAEELTLERPCLLLLWRCPGALIVGRTDCRLPEFTVAADRLRAEGWPVVIRRSGGSACPVSPGTLQIALARIARPDSTIDSAYLELAGLIRSGLESCGLTVDIGEQPGAFCPGRYDISVGGRKLAGLSQHWRLCHGRMTVTIAASLLVDADTSELAGIVDLFYRAAGGNRYCLASAIGTLRQALPANAATGTSLMDDICRRIVDPKNPRCGMREMPVFARTRPPAAREREISCKERP